MTALRSVREGLRRAAGAPGLLLGLWLISVLAALPAALVMERALADSIGASLFHRTLAEGFDTDWWAELRADAGSGTLASTLGPSTIGAGAVYDTLDAWWSGRLFTAYPVALVALGVAYALLWTLLAGGILDRLAASTASSRGRRGLAGFLAAGGRTFGRFVVLTAISGVLYVLIYLLGRRLYAGIETATRDVTSERAVLGLVLLAAGVVVVLLHLVRMVFDYAKIAVYSDDLSAPRGLLRGVSFVVSRPARTVGVYAVLGLLALAIVALYALLAPGPGQSSAFTLILALLGSQLYLAARLAVRLSLLGAELHLYRAS